MSYDSMLRRMLLEKVYYKMSDEEKKTFIQLTMQNKGHAEIMDALDELKHKADGNHHSFRNDLLANISGNAIWDGAVWLLSKIVRKL